MNIYFDLCLHDSLSQHNEYSLMGGSMTTLFHFSVCFILFQGLVRVDHSAGPHQMYKHDRTEGHHNNLVTTRKPSTKDVNDGSCVMNVNDYRG